jgi:hypothetical protein
LNKLKVRIFIFFRNPNNLLILSPSKDEATHSFGKFIFSRSRSAARQIGKKVVLASNQRFFLSPIPTFKLPFESNGIGDLLELLAPARTTGRRLLV